MSILSSPGTSVAGLYPCRDCETEKPAEEMKRSRGKPQGLCKACDAARKKVYYRGNAEARKAYRKQHDAENPEKVAAGKRRYYEEHKEEIAERDRLYREKNLEAIRLQQRVYDQTKRDKSKHYRATRKWAAKNPEKMRLYVRRYAKANPDVRRANERRRRARLLAAEGSHTARDVRLQLLAQKGRCWWCGGKLTKQYHVDHRIALSKGGSDGPENIVISCQPCNSRKSNKFPWEFQPGRLL